MARLSEQPAPRFACDAMCGGLARWLRALGYDAFYHAGIDDAELVRVAAAQGRIVLSSDGKMFERRLLRDGVIPSFRLPHGLRLAAQLRLVVQRFRLEPRTARCTVCNGELTVCSREAVGSEVPARSLLWATEFYRCENCSKVFWNGSHWQRIGEVRRAMSELLESAGP
jgi:uncharacterized protein with PIN domain